MSLCLFLGAWTHALIRACISTQIHACTHTQHTGSDSSVPSHSKASREEEQQQGVLDVSTKEDVQFLHTVARHLADWRAGDSKLWGLVRRFRRQQRNSLF